MTGGVENELFGIGDIANLLAGEGIGSPDPDRLRLEVAKAFFAVNRQKPEGWPPKYVGQEILVPKSGVLAVLQELERRAGDEDSRHRFEDHGIKPDQITVAVGHIKSVFET